MELKENEKWKALFPRPTKEQLEALKHDIRVHSQIEPITVTRDSSGDLVIVDGYSRYQACRELGIEPRYEINENLKTEQDIINFIKQKNALRRDLTEFSRIESILKCIENLTELSRKGRPKKNEPHGCIFSDTRIKHLAIQIGVSKNTLSRALYIIKNGDEKLKEELREGKVGIKTAYEQLKKSTKPKRIIQKQLPRRSKVAELEKEIKRLNKYIQELHEKTDLSQNITIRCPKCNEPIHLKRFEPYPKPRKLEDL
jgi:ParB-like chromosome segregation protein Spo0J